MMERITHIILIKRVYILSFFTVITGFFIRSAVDIRMVVIFLIERGVEHKVWIWM